MPVHVKYILLELLKNSMRATVEKHGVDRPPPIKIIVSDGESNSGIMNTGIYYVVTALSCSDGGR